MTDQERVDEAMKESFPASDPPSWNVGLSHEPAQPPAEALADRFPWLKNWSETKTMLKQTFGQLPDDLFCQEGDEVLIRLGQKLGISREELGAILSAGSGA